MSMFRDRAAHDHNARPIIRVGKKYGMEIHFVCFDVKPIFVTTHYNHRTFPCMKSVQDQCMHCEDKTPIRERAYIGGAHVGRKIRGCLELTEKAGKELAEIAENCEIRGRVLRLTRAGNKPNGSIIIEPTETEVTLPVDVNGWSTEATLCATWGIDVPGINKLEIHPSDPQVSGDFAADEFKEAS